MIIIIKNKDTLLIDDFKFGCSVGKNGFNKKKLEGDLATPKGKFNLGDIYYRADRVQKPLSKLKSIPIKKNMGWCDDPNSKFYNKQIKLKKNLKISYEKLYRKDNKYDLFILIKYNYYKTKKNKGSAIFIHLTKNYKATAGCIAISKKDFLILSRILKRNSQIVIS